MVELLAKLLKGEIKIKSDRNIVEGRKFSDMLQKTLNQYHDRAIATAEIIEELIKLAEEIRSAQKRGKILNLTDDELAFYDALSDAQVQSQGGRTSRHGDHLVEPIGTVFEKRGLKESGRSPGITLFSDD